MVGYVPSKPILTSHLKPTFLWWEERVAKGFGKKVNQVRVAVPLKYFFICWLTILYLLHRCSSLEHTGADTTSMLSDSLGHNSWTACLPPGVTYLMHSNSCDDSFPHALVTYTYQLWLKLKSLTLEFPEQSEQNLWVCLFSFGFVPLVPTHYLRRAWPR